jgi:hypothetical protein
MDDSDMEQATGKKDEDPPGLPVCAEQFITAVVRKMGYRKRVRQEVREELTAHFEDELRDATDAAEREKSAKRLIQEFGDAGLLAILCRRGKRRCRPLWVKVVVRSAQAVGIVMLYSLLCSLRLFVGSPSLKVDYLAWLSDRTRAGREETLNAKPYFDKAAKALTDTEFLDKVMELGNVRPADMNEAHRQILAQVAEHNAGAFELLRQGVDKPHYWVEYGEAVHEPLPSAVMEPSRTMMGVPFVADPAWAFSRAVTPSAAGYRKLAQAFRASILWRASQGDLAGALDDSLVLVDFGMHLEGRGTQIEQLVGIALDAMGTQTVWMLLDSHEAGERDLARVQTRLADLYVRHSSLLDLTGDTAVWLAMIQRTFTDDGSGNGRVLKQGLPLAASGWKDGLTSLLSFGYPDRREMISLIERYCSEYQLALETPPSDPQYEARQARWQALAGESFLLSVSAPAMERMVALVWRVTASRRALLTTVAVLRYGKDHGVYPATLDTLVADGYMKELPIDPYSGKAFGYRVTGDDFLLYSWGLNLVDDGGRQGTGQNGAPRMYAENGDWVFWPVQAPSQAPKTPARSDAEEEKRAEYRAAAPLNHTARIERMGSYLKFDYELIGSDGKKHDLWGISEHPELTFSVYQGDARVGIGKFEYG